MIMPSEEGIKYNMHKVDNLEVVLAEYISLSSDAMQEAADNISTVARESANVFELLLNDSAATKKRLDMCEQKIQSLSMWLVLLLIATVAMAVYVLTN